MAISFPSSPTTGDEYTDGNGVLWKYDGTRWATNPSVQNTPVDGNTERAISSNWAYDHEANTNFIAWSGTQAEYDALGSYDSGTLYLIV